MRTGYRSNMRQDMEESVESLKRQLFECGDVLKNLGSRLRRNPPKFVATCGRGSSDHALLLAKYLIEIRLEIPVTSISPSIFSIYERTLKLEDSLVLVVSQSGRSPDIIRVTERARAAGALVVAFTNDLESPCAKAADFAVSLCAAPERSIAATKSVIASLFALVQLVAHWAADDDLFIELSSFAIRKQPVEAIGVLKPLTGATTAFVLGRGPAFAIAREVALKLKETSALHAEALSFAEVMHGPLALAQAGMPVIAILQDGPTAESDRVTLQQLKEIGADVMSFEAHSPSPLALLEMLSQIYRECENLSWARGLHPDKPPHIRKVTETV